jgi:hypothetical protein
MDLIRSSIAAGMDSGRRIAPGFLASEFISVMGRANAGTPRAPNINSEAKAGIL